IGNVPMWRSIHAAARDYKRKFQNGYGAADDTSLDLRKQRLEYRHCQSSSKSSIKRWYEQFKGTGNVQHREGAGRQ
ncbi:hypothetical protein AVEN_190009-1, partial [Araneus ventricosus]